MLGRLKETYEDALLESSSTLTSVENALRQLTWFLPGRFEDAEIASEGLYSALSVLSIYHDSLIAKRIAQIPALPPSPFPRVQTYSSKLHPTIKGPKADSHTIEKWSDQNKLPPPSDHARYTQHYCQTSRAYNRASRTLVFIQYVQLLTEMVVKKRKGDQKRWKVLLWLEGIKSALRLVMLGATKRPLLSSPIPGREVDPSQLPSKSVIDPQSDLDKTMPDLPSIPALPPAPLHTHVLPLNDSLPSSLRSSSSSLLPPLSTSSEWIGEVMNATEGLVAVLTFIWSAKQRRATSMAPPGITTGSWSLSTISKSTTTTTAIPLMYMMVSRLLRRKSHRGDEGMTSLLAQTYAERDHALAWTFLRGALWQRYTRIKTMRLLEFVDRIWGVRLLATLIRDHIDLVDDLYYYTST